MIADYTDEVAKIADYADLTITRIKNIDLLFSKIKTGEAHINQYQLKNK
jgi:hypothetical protein